MSKGTQNIAVDSNLYVAEADLSSLSADSYFSPIPDSFRYFSGNFYTAKNGNLIKNSQNGLFSVQEHGDVLVMQADKSRFIDDTQFVNGILTREYSKDKWSSFISTLSGSTANKKFEDSRFTLDTPLNIAELGHGTPAGGSYINREFVYNFHAPEFENLLGDPFLDVKTLPTVYSVFTDKRADIRTEKENLELSLGGYIGAAYVDSLSLSNTPDGVSEYFQQYAKTYNLQDVRPVINKLKEANSTVVLTDTSLEITKNLHNKFIPFPHYTSIQFGNPSYNQYGLSRYLKKDNKLYNDLIDYIGAQATTPETNLIVEKPTVNEIAAPFYDVKKWTTSVLNTYKSEGDATEATPGLYSSYNELLKYIKANMTPKVRKYGELSQPAYNEVLFYKITKHQYNFDSTPIQTWLVVPTESSTVQVYDTQIKYGVEYFYKITAYVIVIGNIYEYSDTYYGTNTLEKAKDIENGTYKFKYKNTPTYKILEVPFAKLNGAVHQDPLTKPVASFHIFNGDVAIHLQDSSGQSLEEFDPVENGDLEIFESIRKSQENEDYEKIRSSGTLETDYKNLQIYKILQRPVSYGSYQGKLYKSILLQSQQRVIYEKLTPNKPYYYLFRYVNAHGVPSNASTIHKVTLIDEDGYRYIQTDIVDLNPEYARQSAKQFKKYLLIRPSALQLLPANNSNPEKAEDIVLGPSDEKVWNKQFLLKIRSLKSGRVLNYRFGVNLTRENKNNV